MEMLKTVNDFVALVQFLGADMTPEIASKIMDRAKQSLSMSDIEGLVDIMAQCDGGDDMITELSQYEGEMGGFGRY